MFYSYDLLCRQKNGKFSTIWLAATKNHKKLNKCLYLKVNIATTCSEIANIVMVRDAVQRGENHRVRFSLYLSSMLLYGACLVYRQQVILFGQHMNVIWEGLHSTATILENMQKARHSRTDGEESEDDESPAKKKPRRKRIPKKKTVAINSVEDLENNLERVIAENVNVLDQNVEQNVVDQFQLLDPIVPIVGELEFPDGMFGTLDNALLDRLIEGNTLFAQDEAAVIEELNESELLRAANDSAKADGNEILPLQTSLSEISDGIQQERALATNVQVPTEILADETAAQPVDPVIPELVDIQHPVQSPVLEEMEVEVLQGRTTVDQVIDDVVNARAESETSTDNDPPPKRQRRWKKGVFADKVNEIDFQEINALARNPVVISKKRRVRVWDEDLLDVKQGTGKKRPLEQLLDEPGVALLHPEIQEFFGTLLEWDGEDIPSHDRSRAERSSISSLDGSTSIQQVPLIDATLEQSDEPLPVQIQDKSLPTNRSMEGIVPLPAANLSNLPIVEENVDPEMNQPNEMEIVVGVNEEENLIQMEIPGDEPMPTEIPNADDAPAGTQNVQPPRGLINSSQMSNESMSISRSQDTRTVFSTLQELWGGSDRHTTFTQICPPQTASKKQAAKVFNILLELHKMKKVRLHQISAVLIEIYRLD